MSSPSWRRGKNHGPHTHRELKRAGSRVMGVKVSLQECCHALLPLLAGAATLPGPSLWALDHIFCHCQNFAVLFSISTSLFFLLIPLFYTHKWVHVSLTLQNALWIPEKSSGISLGQLALCPGCLPVASVSPSLSWALLASSALAA